MCDDGYLCRERAKHNLQSLFYLLLMCEELEIWCHAVYDMTEI